MAGIGRVGWEELNQSLVLLAEARGFPGGRAAEPQGSGLDTGSRGSPGVGSQRLVESGIPGGHRGGSWGLLGIRGADLGSPVHAWEQALKWGP